MGAIREPTVGLYETDYYAWTRDQAEKIRRGDLKRLDAANLIEEIESLGRSEERELESRLEQLLMHLLKWQHQPSKRSASWTATIREQRRRIARLLKRMPSLRAKAGEFLQDDYELARELAADQTGIDLAAFALTCPYTVEQVLQVEWFPVPEN